MTRLAGLVAGLECCVGLAVVKGGLAVPKSAGTVVVAGAAVSKWGLWLKSGAENVVTGTAVL